MGNLKSRQIAIVNSAGWSGKASLRRWAETGEGGREPPRVRVFIGGGYSQGKGPALGAGLARVQSRVNKGAGCEEPCRV